MKLRTKKLAALFALLALTACTNALPERVNHPSGAPTPLPLAPSSWIGTQLSGAPSGDVRAKAIARAADGSLYQAGVTNQPLDGEALTGAVDAFLIKYAADGTKLWTRLLGGVGATVEVTGAVTDPSGNIYFAGHVGGDFDGHVAVSYGEAYLVKYDPSGNKLWSRVMPAPSGASHFSGLTTDALGNVFVVGGANGDIDGHVLTGTADLLLVKYDPFGNRVWSSLYGESGGGINARAVVLDGTDIVVGGHASTGVVGETTPAPGNVAGFLIRVDEMGNEQSGKMFGTAGGNASVAAIARDSAGNLYLAGNAIGIGLDGETHSGGTSDGFVTSYTAGFSHRWTRQFGAGGSFDVQLTGLSLDPSANVSVTGYTNGGTVNGQAGPGAASVLLVSYSGGGIHRHTSVTSDAGGIAVGYGLVTDLAGACYVAGAAGGTGYDSVPAVGAPDALLVKFAADGTRQ